MQSTSLPAPTRDQAARLEMIAGIGCLACILKTGVLFTPAEIHHLIDGGRRISHSASVALCPWHHRGTRTTDHGLAYYRKVKGPSLALEPAQFAQEFGEDPDLLEAQERILAQYRVGIEIGGKK